MPQAGPFQLIEVLLPLLISAWALRELVGFLRSAYFVPNTVSVEETGAQRAEDGKPVFEGVAPKPFRQPVDRTDTLVCAGIACLFFLLAVWRLQEPPKPVFDEVYHARAGMEYLAKQDPHEWTHPPLAKLFIAGSLWAVRGEFDARDGVWKDNKVYASRSSFGWRFASLLFGTFALMMVYALARSLFGNRFVACVSAFLLACDGVFWVESRIAMTNVFTVFWTLTATFGAWKWTQTGRAKWILLMGGALGLGLATRWTTLWVWGLLGLFLLWHTYTKRVPEWSAQKRFVPSLLIWGGTLAGALIVLPLGIYFASYLPYMGQGHGWDKVWSLQGDMWRYHAGIKETHSYSSPWWSWPLMVRPTWYFFEQPVPSGPITGIWAIGNAAIWWASIPVMLCAGFVAWREKSAALGLMVLMGLGQWLSWGIEPRPLIFMHYYLESIPFVCVALAYFLFRLWHSSEERYRLIASTYLSLAIGWLIYYYPVLTAFPISPRYFQGHLWLGKPWI